MSRGSRRALAAPFLLLLVVTGCSTGDASSDGTAVDASWAQHDIGAVVVSVPPGWEELDRSEGDALAVTFGPPDDGSMVRPGLTVNVNGAPTRDANGEAESFVLGERAQRGAEDVETDEVDLPGAVRAVEIALWNEQRSTDGFVEVASRWIIADLEGGEQVVMGVLGPRAEFDELPLDEVLEAVVLEGGDGA